MFRSVKLQSRNIRGAFRVTLELLEGVPFFPFLFGDSLIVAAFGLVRVGFSYLTLGIEREEHAGRGQDGIIFHDLTEFFEYNSVDEVGLLKVSTIRVLGLPIAAAGFEVHKENIAILITWEGSDVISSLVVIGVEQFEPVYEDLQGLKWMVPDVTFRSESYLSAGVIGPIDVSSDTLQFVILRPAGRKDSFIRGINEFHKVSKSDLR